MLVINKEKGANMENRKYQINEDMTIGEIAKELGITTTEVNKILKSGLAKLKRPTEQNKKFKEFLKSA